MTDISLDPEVLASLGKEGLKNLFGRMMAEDPEAFGSFLKENQDARRAAKAAVGTVGRTRAPSFLTDTMEIGLLAMADALGVEACEDDADTVSAVLASIVDQIREKKDGTGTQEAYTLSYAADGVDHRVRVTFLSESAAADNILAKALETIRGSDEGSFKNDVAKWQKSIKRQRIDKSIREQHLEAFNEAVTARKLTLTASDDNGASAAPPPAPPA